MRREGTADDSNRLRTIEETEKAKRALLERKKEEPVVDPLANVRCEPTNSGRCHR